jgi:hypothetical protein
VRDVTVGAKRVAGGAPRWLALLGATVGALAVVTGVRALPVPGVSTECSFSASGGGRTTCTVTTITLAGSFCFDDGSVTQLISEYDYVATSFTYAGNATWGDPIDGTTTHTQVKPHAKLLSIDGSHAFAEYYVTGTGC